MGKRSQTVVSNVSFNLFGEVQSSDKWDAAEEDGVERKRPNSSGKPHRK